MDMWAGRHRGGYTCRGLPRGNREAGRKGCPASWRICGGRTDRHTNFDKAHRPFFSHTPKALGTLLLNQHFVATSPSLGDGQVLAYLQM
jgi:hypothetical protein